MIKRIIINILLFIYSLPILAAPVDDLSKLLDKIKTMEANFQQKTIDNKKIVNENDGKMYLEKPGKFRWENTSGRDKLLIVVDGRKIWNYDVELEQVTVEKLNTKTDFAPLRLLLFSDISWLQETFEIKKDLKDKDCFQLTAKDEEETIKELQVCFAKETINKIVVESEISPLVEFCFDNVRLNTKIESNKFKLEIPPNTDVIGDIESK